ncbi:MAG: hypothetical protein HETSPECPRED_009689 [Heterodermia speciosa]|uniref:Uncharacterized protein n=1 Tax=Heterodermia speciosa TaxID=116794 RepID=A0A8H3G238_9LECA|nr:MAG: hypothetical protein HETSPECPRED_009689 [Heterodermia speciosa]
MTRLPLVWNREHDKFVCYCEGLGNVPIEAIAKSVKARFPELNVVSLSILAVERRIMALDEQLNDYFVRGMEQAIIREEKAGYIIPPYDDEIYAVKEESKSREVTEEDITDDDHEDNDDDHDEDTANEDERPVQEMAVDNRAPHVEEDKRQSGISLLKPVTYNARGSNAGQRPNLVEGSGEIRQTIREVKQGKENRDYVIPIRRPTPDGLAPSGTSAILSRRAGLKDSGSLASLNYTGDGATSSSFDAVGGGLQIPRSESIPRSVLSPGHGFNAVPRSYLPRHVNRTPTPQSNLHASD